MAFDSANILLLISRSHARRGQLIKVAARAIRRSHARVTRELFSRLFNCRNEVSLDAAAAAPDERFLRVFRAQLYLANRQKVSAMKYESGPVFVAPKWKLKDVEAFKNIELISELLEYSLLIVRFTSAPVST